FNPAALTRVKNIDLSVDYLDWFLDISHYAFSTAFSVRNIGSFGLLGIFTDVGEIKVTTVESLGFVDGVYLGYTGETFKPGAQVFGVSFARQLTDKFSFGLTAKYARENLGPEESADNFMFDGGLIYSTGFKSLKIAAVVRHFGPEVRFYDKVKLPRYDIEKDTTLYQTYTGKSYPLPQTFNIGISSYLISPGESLFLHSENQTLLVAFDMVQPRDYDQQYNIGLEYGFNNILFLRGGYKVNYDEESYSFGFGLAYDKYRIDYAFNDFGEFLDSVHRFSFGLSIQ
ncbi:MAG: PorV/PorQ family protein, partial [bacterium]